MVDMENNRIIVPQAFRQGLKKALESHAYVFITAHTGWGKTAVAQELLRDTPHTFVSLWNPDALHQAAADTTGLIVLDDFQAVYDCKGGSAAAMGLLRALPPDTRCLLLSRADVPEALLPFLATGQMVHMPFRALALDAREIRQLLEAAGAPVPSPGGLNRLLELTRGNPALVLAAGGCLEDDSLTPAAMEKSKALYFSFLDSHLFQHWDPMERRLLMLVSFFDRFTADMARVLTGDPEVEAVLERLRQTGSFLTRDGDAYRFQFPLMNRYLQHKALEVYQKNDGLRGIYDALSLCCRLSGDLPAAVSYSLRAQNPIRTTELLTAFIRSRPSEGIRTMAGCYEQVPEQDRENIPELLCGMSMIRSQEGLTKESERYFELLVQCGVDGGGAGRTPRTARCLAAYLALYLPHRSHSRRGDDLTWITEGQARGALALPEFSLTASQPSILRGLWDMSGWMAEEQPPFQRLLAQQLGEAAPDALTVICAERAYEKGEYPWERIGDLISVQADAMYNKQVSLEFAAVILSARMVCTQKELPLAFHITASIRRRLEGKGLTGLLPYADAAVCRVSLLGDCTHADAWYEQNVPESMDACVQNRYLCLTRARCCIRHQAYQKGYGLLTRLTECLKAQSRTLDVIETLMLSAVCRRRMGGDGWQPLLAGALELAQGYGYTAIFAEMGAAVLPLLEEVSWPEHEDFLTRLRRAAEAQAQRYPGYLAPLHAAADPHPARSPDLLNERERMLFNAICLRYTNEQICESMDISPKRLARLANSLYGKLRTDSWERIRELGMILTEQEP